MHLSSIELLLLQLWGADGLVGTRNALISSAAQNAHRDNHGAAAQRHEQ